MYRWDCCCISGDRRGRGGGRGGEALKCALEGNFKFTTDVMLMSCTWGHQEYAQVLITVGAWDPWPFSHETIGDRNPLL